MLTFCGAAAGVAAILSAGWDGDVPTPAAKRFGLPEAAARGVGASGTGSFDAKVMSRDGWVATTPAVGGASEARVTGGSACVTACSVATGAVAATALAVSAAAFTTAALLDFSLWT